MKAKLIVEGKEFEVTINHPELEKLVKPEKKTGYERVDNTKIYYTVTCDNVIADYREKDSTFNTQSYEIANYYSDKTIAENNARADKLMRQLRRFSVEHREKEIDWNNWEQKKCKICFDCHGKELFADHFSYLKDLFAIYFDSEETAKLAIETFHDELIWYFTEYKDSL